MGSDVRIGLRLASLFSLLALLLLSALASAEPKRLTILHFNDLHGHLEAEKEGSGAARIATIIHDIEEENRARGAKTVVLFGGDAITGTLLSSEYEGAVEFDFLNLLGVDAMVIGNHELDDGVQRLRKLIAKAAFPVLSANVYVKGTGERFARPCALLPGDPLVGVVGLTSEETRVSTHPSNVAELDFTDPIVEAKRVLRSKECAAPFMVALTHLGVRGDVALARKVKGFETVIGGHDHVPPDEDCRTVGKIPVCQTPSSGKYIGRLDCTIDGKQISCKDSALIPVTAETAEDDAVAHMIERFEAPLREKYNQVVGRATENLSPQRGKQSKLGGIIAEAVRVAGGAEAALVNSGGIRAPIKRGPIRLRDVAEVLPFKNGIVVLSVTGRQLEEMLSHGVKQGGGAFPQVAGMSFGIDDKRPVNILVGAVSLDPDRVYTVATIDFLAAGGDGYTMLKGIPGQRMTNILLSDAALLYIRKHKVIP